MLCKGKAGDAEEVSLMYRNAGEQALPAFGLLVRTGGSREAHIQVETDTLPYSRRRFRAGTVLGLSLDTQTAATSPD